MIFDATITIVWGLHEPHPYKVVNLIVGTACVLIAPPTAALSLSIDIRPVNNPAMACKGSGEGKNHTSIALNQNLAVMKLSEDTRPTWRRGKA